ADDDLEEILNDDLMFEEEMGLEESEDLQGKAGTPPVRFSAPSGLSNDPIKLYLREIGRIALLNAEREFRLATRNEAKKRLDWLLTREKDTPRKTDQTANIFNQVIADLLQTYKNLLVFCGENLVMSLPDFSLVLAEAQALREAWLDDSPSYTR